MASNEQQVKRQAFRELRAGGPEGLKRQQRAHARSFLLAFCVLLIGGIALAGGIVWKKLNVIGGGSKGGGAISVIASIRRPREQFPVGMNRVNILLIGRDYNHTNKG